MKYGESFFDIAYLLFAIFSGIEILLRGKNRGKRLMGSAVLILGCGDAFHLVPRVLSYFTDADLTAALGAGKLVTSLTMTVFYMILYRLWHVLYRAGENRKLTCAVYALTALRVVLCLMPQNGWLTNDSSVFWGIARNIPFLVIGGINIVLYFQNRRKTGHFRNVWLLIMLSFMFYMPVAVAAGIVPALGMLMLPKTVCYMALIQVFRKWCLSVHT